MAPATARVQRTRAGRIKFFSRELGYGFVVHDGGRETFFAERDIDHGSPTPVRDDRATFVLGRDRDRSGRPCALCVRVLREA
jgi:cold shock CspA family protein